MATLNLGRSDETTATYYISNITSGSSFTMYWCVWAYNSDSKSTSSSGWTLKSLFSATPSSSGRIPSSGSKTVSIDHSAWSICLTRTTKSDWDTLTIGATGTPSAHVYNYGIVSGTVSAYSYTYYGKLVLDNGSSSATGPTTSWLTSSKSSTSTSGASISFDLTSASDSSQYAATYIPSRTGYKFDGYSYGTYTWILKPNFTATSTSSSSPTVMTLTAAWLKYYTYYAKFILDKYYSAATASTATSGSNNVTTTDSSASVPFTLIDDDGNYLSKYTPSWSNHTFQGWYTGEEGSGSLIKSFSITSDSTESAYPDTATLYAYFTENQKYYAQLVLDKSESGATAPTTSLITGSTYTKDASISFVIGDSSSESYYSYYIPSYTGHTFIGYYNSSGTKVYSVSVKASSTSSSSPSSATVYAKYSINSYTITIVYRVGSSSSYSNLCTKYKAYDYGTTVNSTKVMDILNADDDYKDLYSYSSCSDLPFDVSGTKTITVYVTHQVCTGYANANSGSITSYNNWTTDSSSGYDAVRSYNKSSQISTLPTVSRSKYSFLGWYYKDTSTVVLGTDKVTSNFYIAAKWLSGSISASGSSDTQIDYSFSFDNETSHQYSIYRSVGSDGAKTRVRYGTAGSGSFSDTDCEPATSYYYWLYDSSDSSGVQLDYAIASTKNRYTITLGNANYSSEDPGTLKQYKLNGATWEENTSGNYYAAQSCKVEATANDGFAFNHWVNLSGEELSQNNPYTFNVSATMGVYAGWKKKTYDISVYYYIGTKESHESSSFYNSTLTAQEYKSQITQAQLENLLGDKKDYYTFSGCSQDLPYTVLYSTTLYVYVQKITYTGHANFAGGSVSEWNNWSTDSSGSYDAIRVYDKEEIITALPTLTRSNYNFINWVYTDSGNVVDVTKPVTADFSVKAVWKSKEITVKVTYKVNGGTTHDDVVQSVTKTPEEGSESISVDLYGQSQTGFVRSNYTLASWNTQSDGKGISYDLNKTVTLANDLILYAIWSHDTMSSFVWLTNDTTDNSNIAKDQPVSNMTATAWNKYATKVNALQKAIGDTQTVFNTVNPKDVFTGYLYNKYVQAINKIITDHSLSTTKQEELDLGTDNARKHPAILASLLNGSSSIKQTLNDIITWYNTR